jgi:hypothetical protein
MIKRLSPTALHSWEKDREIFYCRYLSPNRPPRPPQTNPMSVGSSFDAFVKSDLCNDFYEVVPDQFLLRDLFNDQVEEDVRTFAWGAGQWCFDRYRACGAYDELCEEMRKSTTLPRFEFSLKEEVGGVPLQGKPDLEFNVGVPFVHDWKVNGYCGTRATSPKPLYKYCRDTWNLEHEAEWEARKLKGTRGGDKAHAKYNPMDFHGVEIGKHWMEDVNKKWADQVAIYAWMIGIPVGNEDWIASIDQLACKPWADVPLIRVAQHRCRVSSFWQFSLLGRLQSCWRSIQSGHIFSDMTLEESKARCEVLDMQIHDDDEFWGLVAQKGQSW